MPLCCKVKSKLNDPKLKEFVGKNLDDMSHNDRHKAIEYIDKVVHNIAKLLGVPEITHDHVHKGESILHCTNEQLVSMIKTISKRVTAVIGELDEECCPEADLLGGLNNVMNAYVAIHDKEEAAHAGNQRARARL